MRCDPRDYPDDHVGWMLLIDALTDPRPLCDGTRHDGCRSPRSSARKRDTRDFVEKVAARLRGDQRAGYLRWCGR